MKCFRYKKMLRNGFLFEQLLLAKNFISAKSFEMIQLMHSKALPIGQNTKNPTGQLLRILFPSREKR